MNDPRTEERMVHVRKWLAMPLAEAKKEMLAYMHGYEMQDGDSRNFSELDFDLVRHAESVMECLDLVFVGEAA